MIFLSYYKILSTTINKKVGNSGGPLLNLDGKCVGMNTMMASIGIAFALPTLHLLDFLQQVKGFCSFFQLIDYKQIFNYI